MKFGDFAKINQFINIDDEDSFNTYLSIGVNSLNKKELFLTNGIEAELGWLLLSWFKIFPLKTIVLKESIAPIILVFPEALN